MDMFARQFIAGGTYFLPDGLPVRALLYNLECLHLEWVFEDMAGVRQLGVLPDGSVQEYVVQGRDFFGLVYETRPSDLTVDDLRAP
ncbi:MAG TPA: hypothetical protein PLO33_09285 [Kouleothrix sp.]|uniref:hypothetical protein n=1 Tax=Kouleothrix sp. TaxID=2779161 RepID=UPI002C4A6140|nr:hypothetical protein [Kouleothrix sp.]HRC75862.1 hypothetical protein [Kouleothrix sp.]